MVCKACGKVIPDDSIFCESCGAGQVSANGNQTAQGSTVSPAEAPARIFTVATDQIADAHVRPSWGTLSIPNKIAFLSCVATFAGFFFSWLDIPAFAGELQDLLRNFGGDRISQFAGPGPAGATISISGFTLAKIWGAFYLHPTLAVIAVGLLYWAVSRSHSYARELQASAWHVLIGTLAGPQLLFTILFIPVAQKFVGLGLWLTALGFCGLAAGGLLNIVFLSQQREEA